MDELFTKPQDQKFSELLLYHVFMQRIFVAFFLHRFWARSNKFLSLQVQTDGNFLKKSYDGTGNEE